MAGHSNGHGHDHGCDDAGHVDTPEMGLQYSLYTKIDTVNLKCLNESVEGSGKDVFKPWEERRNFQKFVKSDVDEELLFNIPFTGNVKLKGVIVLGGEGESHPSKMRLYKNRENMSFDDIQVPADQEFDLHHDADGTSEYPTTVVKFATVHHLSIHFPRNFGSETTKIYYIGLRGEFHPAHKHGVTVCTYEARPAAADHKVEKSIVNHEVE